MTRMQELEALPKHLQVFSCCNLKKKKKTFADIEV